MTTRTIDELASTLGLNAGAVHRWGPGRAKVEPARALPDGANRNGRLVLVSALNPTPAGEGKTVTTIGLGQGLARRGLSTCVALREPSMGPVFGIKGGGTGGGQSCIEPSVDINLHFTGDLHAIGAAHNLLGAAIDHRLHFGGDPSPAPGSVAWPRVIDIGDRALRR